MAKAMCKQSNLKKHFKLPFKALLRARDMYVNSMTSCAGKFGGGAHPCVVLPRSFSISSSTFPANSEEDIRELIKVATARTLSGDKGGMSGVNRSKSVKIGRINEDEPCDKFDDENVSVKAYVFSKEQELYAFKKDSLGQGFTFK